jgi:hypothetical protein
VASGSSLRLSSTNEPVTTLLADDDLSREDVGEVTARHDPDGQKPIVHSDQRVPQRTPAGPDLQVRPLRQGRHRRILHIAEHLPDGDRVVIGHGEGAVQPREHRVHPLRRPTGGLAIEREDRCHAPLGFGSLQLKALGRLRDVEGDLGDHVFRGDLTLLEPREIRKGRAREEHRHGERERQQEQASAPVMREIGPPARAGRSSDRA